MIGSIAVGKSTIVDRLKKKLNNCRFVVEDASQNLFLEEFYANMFKWGFHCQISSLAMITENYLKYDDKIIIYDRCVDEMITFAKMQFEMGNMNNKEFALYQSLYNSILSMIPPVDLFLYCRCPVETSLKRIKKRNRPYEQDIGIDYLQNLYECYEKWVKTIEKEKVEVIDTSKKIDVELIHSVILKRIYKS